jgi:hypothetical protein
VTHLHTSRAAIARAVKNGDNTAERDARQRYAAAFLADRIKAVVAAAPPLSAEQLAELRALLS